MPQRGISVVTVTLCFAKSVPGGCSPPEPPALRREACGHSPAARGLLPLALRHAPPVRPRGSRPSPACARLRRLPPAIALRSGSPSRLTGLARKAGEGRSGGTALTHRHPPPSPAALAPSRASRARRAVAKPAAPVWLALDKPTSCSYPRSHLMTVGREIPSARAMALCDSPGCAAA